MEQNLNLYHIFYTVAKCRNISGAARQLFISQPAISKAISRLEQNLDTTLFLRSSRGVRLTETGELLFRQVESAFQAISQGEEQLRKVQELGMGHLSIGVSTTLCKYVLLPHLSLFTRENPHIQISISCQSTYQTMEALEKGRWISALSERTTGWINSTFIRYRKSGMFSSAHSGIWTICAKESPFPAAPPPGISSLTPP